LDLEAALRETEAALSASELQVEQVQLEGTPILEPDSSGEDSGFSGDDDPEMNLAGDSNQGGGGGGAAADTTAAQQEWGPILQKMRAKHDTSAAERAARQTRKARVDALHLPTELEPTTVHWDLKKFEVAEERVKEKRSRPVNNSPNAPTVGKPKNGKHGWRHSKRMGLAGAVRYWANGSRRNVVSMLLGLIQEFDVANDVRKRLFQKSQRQAETDTYIVDRLVVALDILKGCPTEQHRSEFRLALALVAPTRVVAGDQAGMVRRVSARLRVQRGKRSKRRGERPYAMEASMDDRARFDLAAARFHISLGPLKPGQQHSIIGEPLQPGECVLTRHNGEAELTRFTPEGGCVLTFVQGDTFKEVQFKRCYGKGEGSAGLRRIPPTLRAPPRRNRGDSVTNTTRKAILDHLATVAPTSPHTRDVMRRHVGPFLVEEKPAFIQSDTVEALFELFQQAEPEVALTLTPTLTLALPTDQH